jgi:hypothetical protein
MTAFNFNHNYLTPASPGQDALIHIGDLQIVEGNLVIVEQHHQYGVQQHPIFAALNAAMDALLGDTPVAQAQQGYITPPNTPAHPPHHLPIIDSPEGLDAEGIFDAMDPQDNEDNDLPPANLFGNAALFDFPNIAVHAGGFGFLAQETGSILGDEEGEAVDAEGMLDAMHPEDDDEALPDDHPVNIGFIQYDTEDEGNDSDTESDDGSVNYDDAVEVAAQYFDYFEDFLPQ